MVSVGRHPNITLMSYSEVEKVAGYVGNFTVTVRRKPRYVNEDLCTGCGTCIEKCPWKKIPSEFDLGLGNRSAIFYPFPQAVPRVPVIDTGSAGPAKNFARPRQLISSRRSSTLTSMWA
jgi:heterodisulfide reductase subunit A